MNLGSISLDSVVVAVIVVAVVIVAVALWRAKLPADRAKRIMDAGGPRSRREYLFLFPDACRSCVFRKLTCEWGVVSLGSDNERCASLLAVEKTFTCERCHATFTRTEEGQWNENVAGWEMMMGEAVGTKHFDRITVKSPYLTVQQSELIPDYPIPPER